MRTKLLLSCVVIGAMFWSATASALESFTCTFGQSAEQCTQKKGSRCQHKYASDVYVTCSNLADTFLCIFTKKPWPAATDLGTVGSATSDSSVGHAFAISDPGQGKLMIGFGNYQAECAISQTK
jgi:hypothetical protein